MFAEVKSVLLFRISFILFETFCIVKYITSGVCLNKHTLNTEVAMCILSFLQLHCHILRSCHCGSG